MAKQAQTTDVAVATPFANLFNAQNEPNFENFSILKLDEDSGELVPKPMFKYIPGMPKQYRFDAKNGGFNINGLEKVEGDTLDIQPIAWRFFEDNIMNMGHKEWVEIMFIDSSACVSAIMFHSSSRQNLEALLEQLYYDEVSLSDVVLTVDYEMHTAEKVVGKPRYGIATFKMRKADKVETKILKTFASTRKLYRKATYQETAVVTVQHNFFNPFEEAELEA